MNRIVNNVYIIDSASTSAKSLVAVSNGVNAWPREARIHTVAFTSTSGGDFEMVFASNTASTAFRLFNGDDRTTTEFLNFQLPSGHGFEELRVKTLVNGTGYLYFA